MQAALPRSASGHWLTPGQLRLIVIAVLLLVWEILPRAGVVPLVILAPFTATVVVGFEQLGTFASALLVTLGEIVAGLAIAYLGGGLIGLLVGGIAPLRRTLLPLISS